MAVVALTALVPGCGSSGGDGPASADLDPRSEVEDRPSPGELGPGTAAEDDVLETGPGVVAGEGTATITISGNEYSFTSDYCVGTASSFEILGSGENDGGSFYAEITLDDAAADLDDDGQGDRTGDVSLTVGDDEAIYKSTVLVMGMGDVEEFTYDIGDGAATGSGRIIDVMAGGTNDFEFSAQCT